MRTWIYKGSRKANTYLYVTGKDDFERVPESLLDLMGELQFVLQVDLHKDRTLAQVDISMVRQQLEEAGFFLQLPPGDPGLKPC